MGLQFTRIEVYLLGFFLNGRSAFKGGIRSNRAKFIDQSQSSLNAGESQRTQDLAQKSLNCFTIQSRVKRRRENTSVFMGEFPGETWVVWCGEDQLMATIARSLWTMIAQRSWATISRDFYFRRPIAIISSRWVWCVYVCPHEVIDFTRYHVKNYSTYQF